MSLSRRVDVQDFLFEVIGRRRLFKNVEVLQGFHHLRNFRARVAPVGLEWEACLGDLAFFSAHGFQHCCAPLSWLSCAVGFSLNAILFYAFFLSNPTVPSFLNFEANI